MQTKVDTKIQTPADLLCGKIALVVPSYQRPYVWPDDDVLKFIEDIYAAKVSKEPHYYIGTLLTSAHKPTRRQARITFELIDGQQRMTTLMLIALALRDLKSKTKLIDVAVLKGRPRLNFAIRENVQSLLGAWANLAGYRRPKHELIDADPYLTRLHGALAVLKQRLGGLAEDERDELSDYIFDKVHWVNNVVPVGVDLNRLFATMNTSGIQLEQSDILKSLLLKNIKNNKSRYDAIWQVCEQMDNYFERNVRQVFSASGWNSIKPDALEEFDSDVFLLSDTKKTQSGGVCKPLTIAELAKSALKSAGQSTSVNVDDIDAYADESKKDMVYCRSIIGFPLLLMHAYRVYLGGDTDIKKRLHSDMLIECFSDLINAEGREIRRFFECLWRVRYQFDRWVVKWVKSDDEGEEVLSLASVHRNKSDKNYYLQRSYKESSPLSQLQCVRYFTGERSAQYWLTPFLAYLADDDEYKKDSDVLWLLEDIDNQLSLARSTQKEASRILVHDDLNDVKGFEEIENKLKDCIGTHFEHYWFQKLEYLLWKKWYGESKRTSDQRFKQYRIVSRNSIEHVYPQAGNHGIKMEKLHLDSFGNLALLNVSQNSAYSDKFVAVKKAMFKADNGAYHSLKLEHLFRMIEGFRSDINEYVERIDKHRSEMLDVLREHYKQD